MISVWAAAHCRGTKTPNHLLSPAGTENRPRWKSGTVRVDLSERDTHLFDTTPPVGLFGHRLPMSLKIAYDLDMKSTNPVPDYTVNAAILTMTGVDRFV